MPKYVASRHFHWHDQVWPKDCDIPTKRFAKKDLEWLLGAGWVKEVPTTEPDTDAASGAEVENHGYSIERPGTADN